MSGRDEVDDCGVRPTRTDGDESEAKAAAHERAADAFERLGERDRAARHRQRAQALRDWADFERGRRGLL